MSICDAFNRLARFFCWAFGAAEFHTGDTGKIKPRINEQSKSETYR